MSFKEGIDQVEKSYQKLIEMDKIMSDAVVNGFMFTWQWWFGIALFIFPWIIWLLFRKKASTGRLLFAGFITILLSLMIDLIALSRGLWSYPMVFSPIGALLFLPYHFSLTPVALMFTLQIKPHANALIKGAIFGAIGAFIAMKIFEEIDFYDPKKWLSIYDFFIYLFLYLVANWFSNMDSFKKVQQ
ncbi:CBO0543 family protein [Virgibacillus halophilus]|uniref:CBO0543 family protein n=1 Tax=Tigheibacillus halophilus TaxID=361280 RepID=UPI00363E802E